MSGGGDGGLLPAGLGGRSQDQGGGTRRAVQHVAVVIPARNESTHIGACLLSVRAAQEQLLRSCPGVTTGIIVVADRCTDDTAELAVAGGAVVVPSSHGNVGAARHEGVLRALADSHASGLAPDEVWIAGTDADTEVPTHWLTRQLEHAAAGVDAVVGTVIPDGIEPPLLRAWLAEHELIEGHAHVHGANLSLRASAYLTVGGFAAMELHEDADLVTRLRAAGLPWIATDTVRVATSGRAVARARGGFADYLVRLQARIAEAPAAPTSTPGPLGPIGPLGAAS